MKGIPLHDDVLVPLDTDVEEVVDTDGRLNFGESSDMQPVPQFSEAVPLSVPVRGAVDV